MGVLPHRSLHTKVSCTTYQLLLKWWLGIPLIPTTVGPISCPLCHSPCDVYGDHFVCCVQNNFYGRHTAVQDALLRILESSSIPCSREQGTGLGGKERPADVLLHHWVGGKDGAVDITVTHALQLSEQPLSPDRVSSHTKREEEKKVQANTDLCEAASWACIPFGMHCWAGLGPSAGALLHQVIKRATSAMSGWPKTQRVLEIKQGLAFALMREIGRQLEVVNRVLEC